MYVQLSSPCGMCLPEPEFESVCQLCCMSDRMILAKGYEKDALKNHSNWIWSGLDCLMRLLAWQIPTGRRSVAYKYWHHGCRAKLAWYGEVFADLLSKAPVFELLFNFYHFISHFRENILRSLPSCLPEVFIHSQFTCHLGELIPNSSCQIIMSVYLYLFRLFLLISGWEDFKVCGAL